VGTKIDKQSLAAFIDILDSRAQSLISFERAVELMTGIGFSCRLACRQENWHQGISFFGPPGDLAPVETEIETPVGRQRITLERNMSLPSTVSSALAQLRHLRQALETIGADGVDEEQRQRLMYEASEAERGLLENGRPHLERSGIFNWPMDRFQLLISHGKRSELVTICGPVMAMLARASLADSTMPGINVQDLGAATVTLLTDRTIEKGSSIGSGFRAREEGARIAQLLREYVSALSSRD
jgi:hypothetical protein